MLGVVLALAWTVLLFVALWGPASGAPELFANDDKVFHLLGFCGVGALWSSFGLPWQRVAVLVTLVAAATEMGQGYLPWPRTPDVVDFAFDLVGGVVGIMMVRWLLAFRQRVADARPSK